ncbi:MAG: YHS domain-containing protein [Acidilobaceae archaeon]|nr:YHS domain-containing protein [Acidilobaceae archaeon]MCX8165901.1 YHS domain-containing protein [Acidilobaceae archaeon]MDW7974543.1 YHS domain-containing protein [Sulfolobales archaeon]
MEIDPVCGMMVDVARARYRHIYKGKVYYFCSHHCLKAFERDPEHYLKHGPQGMPK